MPLFSIFKFLLFVYFLFGMHIVLDTPGGTGLYLSYNIIAWLFVTVLISLGLWQITINKKIYYSKMLLVLTLGCVFLIIPAFYSFESTEQAIPRLLALFAGLLFLFSLYQFQVSTKNKWQLLLLITASVAIEAAFGLIQYFILTEGDWGGYKLGVSRPHGVFLQPNVMASFMATGLAMALLLFSKLSYFSKQRLTRVLLYFTIVTTSFLLVLLQSRTGTIGAIVAVLLLSTYLHHSNKQQFYKNIFLITLAVSSAFISLQYSETPKRSDQTYYSAGARAAIFTVSADMVKAKPLLGFGYGGFERSFIDYFNEYAVKHPDIGNTLQGLSHPHNEVLYWVVEGGIITLLAFVLFTGAYLLTWLQIPKIKAMVLLALIFPILLHSQLEFPFYSSISHWLVFLIILWLTDSFSQVNSTDKTKLNNHLSVACSRTFFIRFFAVFIPLIFIPFFSTSLQTARIIVDYQQSPTQPISALTEIINPIVWQNHLDQLVYGHILVIGLKTKDGNKLSLYVDWANKRLKRHPRIILYKRLLIALKALGKSEAYNNTLVEAKRTFPQQAQW
jgi:O-antigen polymerase